MGGHYSARSRSTNCLKICQETRQFRPKRLIVIEMANSRGTFDLEPRTNGKTKHGSDIILEPTRCEFMLKRDLRAASS